MVVAIANLDVREEQSCCLCCYSPGNSSVKCSQALGMRKKLWMQNMKAVIG